MLGTNPVPLQQVHWQSNALTARLDLIHFLIKFCVKILFCKHYSSLLNTFMRKEKDPDPYLWLMDPGGPKPADPDPQHCFLRFYILNCDAGVQVHVLREHSGGGRERHTQEGQQAHARQVQWADGKGQRLLGKNKQKPVRIHDILVWIRTNQIRGHCYFRHWPSRWQQKKDKK